MHRRELIGICAVVAVGLLSIALLVLSGKKAQGTPNGNHGHSHGGGADGHDHDHSKSLGPHGGKMLTDGDFEVEVVLSQHTQGAHFRLYPFRNHEPVDPVEITGHMDVERLGGKTDELTFKPAGEFLFSEQPIEEPHSYFIKISIDYRGEHYEWEYSHYENRLTVAQDLAERMGLASEYAGPGNVVSIVELPGEIALNADMVSHIVPRLSGVVLESRKNLGDSVEQGEILAVIDSRELGEAKSRYLVSVEREHLARYNFERIQRLWEAQTVSEKEFLTAKKVFTEEKIELAASARKLIALGLTKQELANLVDEDESKLTNFPVRAPFQGVITRKHIAVGEWVKEDAEIYIIADLSSVWVEVVVYAKDVECVFLGQKAKVRTESLGLETSGTVSYVGPLVGEDTRTAKARIVIPNHDRKWRPGLFAKVALVRDDVTPAVVVRNDAVQTYKDKTIVFVQHEDQYEVRPVTLGRSDNQFSEVLMGLSAGEQYATRNSHILKAELGKTGISHEH